MGSAWARSIAILPPVTIVCRANRRPHPTHRSDFVSESATLPLPLFYRKPQPLIPPLHAVVHLNHADYGFSADTHSLPLAIIAFPHAFLLFPIFFSHLFRFSSFLLFLYFFFLFFFFFFF